MLELGIDLADPAGWLPLFFALVMAISMITYVVLDGYDLGVGILLRQTNELAERDTMIASIGWIMPCHLRSWVSWAQLFLGFASCQFVVW